MPHRFVRCACITALAAVLVAAAPRTASAQEGSIVLGFTRADFELSGAGAAPTTGVSGFVVGGAINTSTKRPIGLQVEGLFATKGTNGATGVAVQLYYIECPILARTDVQVSKVVRIHGYVGPQVGYLVHTGGSSGFASEAGDEVTRTDISAVVGGGVDWRGTMVDVRYTRGLNDITSPLLFGSGVAARSRTLGVLFVFRVK